MPEAQQPIPETQPIPDTRPTPDPLVCSARGCRQRAVHALRWNNPKLHPPQRRKTWLACDAHLPTLREFLDVRGFLREVQPVNPP